MKLKKYPTIEAWVKGKTFQEIGENRGVTRQRANVFFENEIKQLVREEKAFMRSFEAYLFKENDTLYNYYDFSSVKYGKLMANLVKRLYGYTVHRDIYALKNKISIFDLKKIVIQKVKGCDNYYPILMTDEKAVGFDNIVIFGVKDITTPIRSKEGTTKLVPLRKSFTQYRDSRAEVIFLQHKKPKGGIQDDVIILNNEGGKADSNG